MKLTHNFLLASFLIAGVGFSQFAFALANEEGHVGNGGGTVVCRDANHAITSVELLDFYEARTIRNVTVDIQTIPGTWQQKAAAVIARVEAKSEFRFQLYSTWLSTFETDSKILTGVQFSTIPDSGYIGMPDGCEFEQAAIQRQPMFPGDARYFLNAELWNAMDDNQKAGLALHEIIYREAIGYGHSTSIRSRYLTAEYSSPDFANMAVTDYWKILIDANFETTDRVVSPTLTGAIQTLVNTARMTQPGPTDPQSPSILLNDRIMVQLGTCDTDCNNFTKAYDFEFPQSSSLTYETILSEDVKSVIFQKIDPTQNITVHGVGFDEFMFQTEADGSVIASIGDPNANYPGHHTLFSVEEKTRSSYDTTGMMNAYALVLQKPSGNDWQWEGYVGKTLDITSPGNTAANLDFVEANGICEFASVQFKNNIPIHVSTYVAKQWPGCTNTADSNTELVGNLYKNGFSRTFVVNSANNSAMLYDPNIEYALANPQVDAYTWTSIGWSFDPGLVDCGNTVPDPDPKSPNLCLHPNLDANQVVQSLLVVDHSPKIWLSNFQFVHVALGSTIQIEPLHGMVTAFVTRDPIQWTQNAQPVTIPAGSTVTLQDDSIQSFQAPTP